MERMLWHARAVGVHVEWKPMGGDLRGYYEHADLEITLSSRPGHRQQRATLAHELGHAHYAHDGSRSHEYPEWERLADDYAARLLIRPDRYATAEPGVGPDACGLAELLDVPPGVVTRWQRLARATPSLLIG